MQKNRWSPFEFKNGKVARNRVVVPPMASQSSTDQGFVTEETLDHYKTLVQSQSAILFVEYSYVHRSGRGEAHQMGVDSDEKIEGMKKLCKIIHSQNTLAGFQIVHTGGKSNAKLAYQKPIGPSAIRVPVKNTELELPRAISAQEVTEMERWYVDAAGRVEEAGYDIVELHAAHGYGLNQWLSPITNQREDDYGGPIENRARLLLDIARTIKAKFPGLLLSVRLPLHDHHEGGLTKEEMLWVVSELDTLGLDLIDVSSGIGGWRRPRDHKGEGYLVSDAAEHKKRSEIPVIGVGGIESGEYIDQVIADEVIDFAAVGRAILKDPKGWFESNLKRN